MKYFKNITIVFWKFQLVKILGVSSCLHQAWARLQNWYKKLIGYDSILIQYENDNSPKGTDLNLILRSFFMKIQMKTVINWDFLISNPWFHIVFPKQNLYFPPVPLRNTLFHIIFPKHNISFSPVSPRNTLFHVISMGKHEHNTVQ